MLAGVHLFFKPSTAPVRVALVFSLVAAAALPSAAQAPATTAADRPPLGSTITVDALATLPSSASLYSLIDVSMPEVVGDRIDSGGLTTGESGRLGAHGSSWTQTTYKLDGVDITAPIVGGTPLFVPGISAWQQVDVTTGLMPIDLNSPGLAILLSPRQASSVWSRTLDISGSPAGLNAHNENAVPPPISRLDTWAYINLAAGGPLVPAKVGAFFSIDGTKSSRFDRGSLTSANSTLGTAFGSFTFAPTADDRVRLVVVGQHASYPFDSRLAWGQPDASTTNLSAHAQIRWDRRTSGGTSFSTFASYTGRNQSDDLLPSNVFVEFLRDGPVLQNVTTNDGSERRWSFGGQVRPAVLDDGQHRHALVLGAELNGSQASLDPTLPLRVGETVNGEAAQLWDFSGSNGSVWHERTLALYANDGIDINSRVRLDVGFRFETIDAAADGATTGVSWRNFLPRVALRWEMLDTWHIASLFSYGRYGYRLPLGDLAWAIPTRPSRTYTAGPARASRREASAR